jgi:hypothetical protein
MDFKIILRVLMGCTIFFVAIKIMVDKAKDKKKVSNNLNRNIEQTDDLKIQSSICRDFLVDFGSEFNYCKFYFTQNEIYLFCRNSYPLNTFDKPYILKYQVESNYSYFSKFRVTKFIINGENLKIQIKNKYFIGTKLTLNIVNISEKDRAILNKNLC